MYYPWISNIFADGLLHEVSKVDPRSAAARAGVVVGDRLVEVAGIPVLGQERYVCKSAPSKIFL